MNRFKRAFWSPLAAIVFEISYGLLSLLRQLLHQITQAARGPQQRLQRVPSRCGRDRTFEIVQKSWILERLLLAPTADLADTSGPPSPHDREGQQVRDKSSIAPVR
jgi:hypothetical protein